MFDQTKGGVAETLYMEASHFTGITPGVCLRPVFMHTEAAFIRGNMVIIWSYHGCTNCQVAIKIKNLRMYVRTCINRTTAQMICHKTRLHTGFQPPLVTT